MEMWDIGFKMVDRGLQCRYRMQDGELRMQLWDIGFRMQMQDRGFRMQVGDVGW